MDKILVSLVLHNDGADVLRCLDSVGAQSVPVRIRAVDNASQDDGAATAERMGASVRRCASNLGYSAGHNANLRPLDFDWALLLNADVVLTPRYLETLLRAVGSCERVGMAGGKILRMGEQGEALKREGSPVIDSTGIYFTPAQRHFDRGSGACDAGQYERRQRVFGITGAALLCSRRLLSDLMLDGEILDEDFFAFREDADLAWRAQLRGWDALYDPVAVALHRRHVLPERRKQLAPLINYHSLKNRYLMRMKNMDRAVRLRCFPWMWLRDAAILGYALGRERSSLAAYRTVLRLGPSFRKKRSQVQSSRLVSPEQIAQWFSFQPVAYDMEG